MSELITVNLQIEWESLEITNVYAPTKEDTLMQDQFMEKIEYCCAKLH